MITNVEYGLINDDFIHDRVTAKIHIDDGSYYPVKVYKSGKIVGFIDERFSEGEYIEQDISPDLLIELRKYLKTP